MNGIADISKLQKDATLREYAYAVRTGNTQLAANIKHANAPWISAADFKSAERGS